MLENNNAPLPADFPEEVTIRTGQSTQRGRRGGGSQTLDLGTLAREDLAKQTAESEGSIEFLDNQWNKLKSLSNRGGATQQEIDAIGIRTVNGFDVNPEYLDLMRDEANNARFYGAYIQENFRQVGGALPVPMSSPDYKQVVLPPVFKTLDPKFTEVVTNIVKDSQDVASALTQTFNEGTIPAQGQKALLNAYATGEFYDEIYKTVRRISPDTARGIPDFMRIVFDGAIALGIGAFEALPFTAEDEKTVLEHFNERQDAYSRGNFRQSYEKLLNNTTLFESVYQQFNKYYKEKFFEQYDDPQEAADAWFFAHQVPFPVLEVVTDPETGVQSQRQARDENGVLQYEEGGLPRNVVRDLLDLGFNKLPKHEQAINYFVEFAPVTYGFNVLNARRAAKMGKIVDKAKFEVDEAGEKVLRLDPETNLPLYRGMSDLEIYKRVRGFHFFGETPKGRLNTLYKNYERAYDALTLQFLSGGQKGLMQRGAAMDGHARTLKNYSADISNAQDNIKDINKRLKDDLPTEERDALQIELAGETERLSALKESRKRYKLGVGTSANVFLDTPFTRRLIMDDAIIASTLAYAPGILSYPSYTNAEGVQESFISPGVANALSMVALPFIAPAAIQGGTKKAISLTNRGLARIPEDLVSIINDAGAALGVMPQDIFRSGNVGEMRAALKRAGITDTEKKIKSFVMLNKVFNSMQPEYREQAYNNLIRYNSTMNNLRAQQKRAGLSDVQIEGNMELLSLSLAQATGIAPLIAIQSMKKDVKVTDLTDGTKLQQLLEAANQERQLIDGISLNFNTFLKNIENQAGVKIEDNEGLRAAVSFMGGVVEQQQKSLVGRQALLQKHVNDLIQFAGGNGNISSDTVTRIMQLTEGIEEIIDPKRVKTAVGEVNRVRKISTDLQQSVNTFLEGVTALNRRLTSEELENAIERSAEDMFYIAEGTRVALARAPYIELDNGGQLFDLSRVARELSDEIDTLRGKPIKYTYLGGKDFVSQVGGELQNTLNAAARRGLSATFDDPDALLRSFIVKKELPEDATLADLAFLLRKRFKEGQVAGTVDENLEVPSYIVGTFTEVEAIHRHFRDKVYDLEVGEHATRNLHENMISKIDNIFEESGIGDAVKNARATYRQYIGEPTSPGTYAAAVNANRTYVDSLTVTSGGMKDRYRKSRRQGGNVPIKIFDEIEGLMQKAINRNTSPDQFNRIMSQIRDKRNELFDFMTLGRLDGDMHVIDMKNDRSNELVVGLKYILDNVSELAFSGRAVAELSKKAAKASPIGGIEVPVKNTYDFSTAQRIEEIENVFRVKLLTKSTPDNPDGRTVYARLMSSDTTGNFAKDYDIYLQEDATVRKAHNDIVEELNNMQSPLMLAAKAEVEADRNTIKAMEQLVGDVSDPVNFYNRFFKNKTAADIEDSIDRFVEISKGRGAEGVLKREQVAGFFQYMYGRHLLELGGVKYKVELGTEKAGAVKEVGDVFSLIDNIMDPAKREVMEAVLGPKHTKDMEAFAEWATFASGNALGLRGMDATKLMSIESAFARAFNLARGMVSPLYVGTEVSTRILLHKNASLIKFALSDPDGAKIMANMLRNPSTALRDEDIKRLGLRLKNYLAREIYMTGGDLPTAEQLIAVATGQEEVIYTPTERIIDESQPDPERGKLEQ